MLKIANLLLTFTFIIGVALVVRQQNELSHLQTKFDPLVAKFGALPVTNKDRYLVTNVDTQDPKQFLWRVYHPAGLSLSSRATTSSGSSSSSGLSSNTNAFESLYRIRFEFDNERLFAHTMFNNGASKFSIGGEKLAKFLETHWNELDVEILSHNATTEIPTTEVMSFLRIHIPDQLWPEFENTIGKRASVYRNGIFHSYRGTEAALKQFDQEQRAGQ